MGRSHRAFCPARQQALADARAVRAQVVRTQLGDGCVRYHAVRLPLNLHIYVLSA